MFGAQQRPRSRHDTAIAQAVVKAIPGRIKAWTSASSLVCVDDGQRQESLLCFPALRRTPNTEISSVLDGDYLRHRPAGSADSYQYGQLHQTLQHEIHLLQVRCALDTKERRRRCLAPQSEQEQPKPRSQCAKASPGFSPWHCLRCPGTQIDLALANLVCPSLGDRGLIVAIQAVKQRNHHCRALAGVERQRFVDKVVNTRIHSFKFNSFTR